MYYFSKHPELNNFLQPKETQQHTKRWGFLLWEEDGLRLPWEGDRMSKTHLRAT